VLLCLVGAMISTTALLEWLDPSFSDGAPRLSLEKSLQLARAAVSDDMVVSPELWRGVELRPGSRTLSAGSLAAVRADPADWHFRVTAGGLPIRNTLWTHQQPCEHSPGVITILVDGFLPFEVDGATHQAGVRALLTALNERIRPEGAELPLIRRSQ